MASVVWLLILAIAALYLTYKLPSMLGDQGIGEDSSTQPSRRPPWEAAGPRALGNIAPRGRRLCCWRDLRPGGSPWAAWS